MLTRLAGPSTPANGKGEATGRSGSMRRKPCPPPLPPEAPTERVALAVVTREAVLDAVGMAVRGLDWLRVRVAVLVAVRVRIAVREDVIVRDRVT